MPISMKFPVGFGKPGALNAIEMNYTDSESKEAIKQNLRVLLLTNPGEYQHDIEYGVGLRQFLFEMHSLDLKETIRSRILEQTSRYMPYISVSNVAFDEDSRDINYLGIQISYYIRETRVLQAFDLFISLDEAGLV